MKSLYISIIIALLAQNLIGQVTPTDISDSVVVTKNLKIDKVDVSPYILEYDRPDNRESQTINTAVTPAETVDLEYTDPPLSINPIRFTHKREKTGNDGLIKAGYGIPSAIDARILYDYHIEDWYHIGGKVGYQSAEDDGRQDMRYTVWDAGVYGGYWVSQNFKVSLDTDFSRLNQSIYGESINTEDTHPDRIIQSIDNRIGLNLDKYAAFGLQMDAVLRYEATELIDEVDTQNYLSADLHIAKSIWNGIDLDITSKAETATMNKIGDNEFDNYTNFIINPSLRYTIDDLHIEAGVFSTFNNDDQYLWPKLLVQYSLIDAPLTLELSTDQTPSITTLKAITDINPFINSNDRIPTQLSVNRDVRFQLAYSTNNLIIKPSYRYRIADDQLLFVKNGITFDLVNNDRINSQRIGAEATYDLNNIGQVKLDGGVFLYSSFIEAFTTYLPKYEVQLTANQSLFDERLLLEQAIYYRQVTAAEVDLVALPIFGSFDPNIIDLSATINFKILPQFWLYAEGNNLLFQDYTIWEGFGVYQPKVLFGIKYLIGQPK